MSNTSPYRYSEIGRLGRSVYRRLNPVPPSPWTQGEVDNICDIHLVPPTRLVSYFSHCIGKLQEIKGNEIGDYLEFGTFNGSSMGSMHIARSNCEAVDHMRLFGFDSFEGLPVSAEQADHGVWKQGDYRCSFEDMQRCLLGRNIDPSDIEWVQGEYSETLDNALANQFNIQNIGIIFVDCDTYPSSKAVLDFVAPRLSGTSIICFDDWRLNNTDLRNDGEYRAFNEFLEVNPDIEAHRLPLRYNRKSESFLLHCDR